MHIIEPNVDLIQQTEGIDGMFLHIERCGRTCYKSEDRITENSAKDFVQRMIESNHTAMLEHGTVYLTMKIDRNKGSEIVKYPWYNNNAICKYREVFGYVQSIFRNNPYSLVYLHHDRDTEETTMCITTNYRVIVENMWEDLMVDLCGERTEWHIPRFTLKFTTNIGVTREGNRMRANSIAEESTRYCDYTKEKHGNGEINIVPPVWFELEQVEILSEMTSDDWISRIRELCDYFQDGLSNFEDDEIVYGSAIAFCNLCYNELRKRGWKPQQAREVLTLATKSDVVYTAFPHQWRHFFDLRLFGKTGTPHPNMKAIASLARDILCEKDLWYLIYRPGEVEYDVYLKNDNATPVI